MERQLFIPSLKPRGDTGEIGFLLKNVKKMMDGDFPSGAVDKNLPVSAGDTRVHSLVQEDSTCHGATKPIGHSC